MTAPAPLLTAAHLLRNQEFTKPLAPSGVPSCDASLGGLPRGAITEIAGPRSSGKTAFCLAALAAATERGEHCAYIDTNLSFDPHSASRAGIHLSRLIWVRCRYDATHALRVADLLLGGGGLGMICLDLTETPVRLLNELPTHAWFRFQRALTNSATTMLVLTDTPIAKSSAKAALAFQPAGARWQGPDNARLLTALEAEAAAHKPMRSPFRFACRAL